MVHNTLFFSGIIAVVLGLLVLAYDYPQVAYIENMPIGQRQMMPAASQDKFERIYLELYAGVAVLGAGAAAMVVGKLWGTGRIKPHE